MQAPGKSTLWVVACAKYGSMLLAARAIGIHPNTLYKASAGISVSAESRSKIEAALDGTLEELQRPVATMATAS